MKTLTVLGLALILTGFGCAPKSQDHAEPKPQDRVESESNASSKPTNNAYNLNLSIFLDLSDRISPKIHPNSSMEYFQRDLGYLNSIASAFENHMLYKKLILMDDRIQLFVDPLPANLEINDIIKELRMSFDRNNTTQERIVSLGATYANNAEQLYDLAIQDNNFIGSDIWGFFKSRVKDYCVSDQYRNVLVIITDGYPYHIDNIILEDNRSSYITRKSIAQLELNTANWEEIMEQNGYGLLVREKELDNLEVLILGINANRQNPYEEDVIRKYWSDWLTAMEVKKFAIKSADLPSNLDEVIQKFILIP